MYQVVKDAFVEFPFGGPALPELLVVVLEAVPVLAEFDEAVLVYVFDARGEKLSAIAH